MKWPPWVRWREAKAETKDAQEKLQKVREQGDRVEELATWARDARERNHLTELLFQQRPQRGGGHA